ncbi:MAG TPA: hypothetical protein VEB20_13135, partial [Azospirillaceae bacterium]|nr:hypothetical protein [Azospirillaceae bacterium]
NIPSLSADGNLPAFLRRHPVEHVIYTTRADAERIERHPAYRTLADKVPSRIDIAIGSGDRQLYGGAISRMNEAHQRILADCRADGATWLFDQPDHVWADGSLGTLAEAVGDGTRCILFAGLKTALEEMIPQLGRFRSEDGAVLSVSPEDLLEAALDCLHRHDMVRFWKGPEGTSWPHHVAWRAGRTAFVRRTFMPQPFVIPPTGEAVVAKRSLDWDFLESAFPDMADISFIEDSRHFLVAEMTPGALHQESKGTPVDVASVGTFAACIASPYQERCFRTPIVYGGWTVSDRRMRRVLDYSRRCREAADLFARHNRVLKELGPDFPQLADILSAVLRDAKLFSALRVPAEATFLLPEGRSVSHLSGRDPGSVMQVVMDHTVAGDWPLARLREAGKAAALSGRIWSIGTADTRTSVDGVPIERPDILCAGFRFHALAQRTG